MPGEGPVGTLLRRGLRRLPRARRDKVPPDIAPPAARVSVVVTVSEQEREHLEGCLGSLDEQSYPDVAVEVIGYGGEGDPVSLGAAFNVGADRSEGDYLIFLEASERLGETALADMVDRLERSGSDFAAGGRAEQGMSRELRHDDGSGLTLTSRPGTVADMAVGNKLFRSSFWSGTQLRFAEAPEAPADPLIIRAYIRAARFDLLAQHVCTGIGRDSGLAFGQVPDVMDGVMSWLDSVHEVDVLLRPPDLSDARREWLRVLFARDATRFVDAVSLASSDQWEAICGVLGGIAAAAGPEVWTQLGWEARVRAQLVANRQRAALEGFVEQRRSDGTDHPTEVRAGRVYAVVPPYRNPSTGVTDDCFELTAAETPLVASLRQIRWLDRDTLELDVFAFLRFVDDGESEAGPQLTAVLVDERGGQRVALEVTAESDPAVNRFARERHQGHDRGAFRITVDAAPLVEPGAWSLELSLTSNGITRSGTVNHREHNGTVGERPRRMSAGLLWGPSPVGDGGVRIEAARPTAVLAGAAVSGRTVRGLLTDLSLDVVAVELEHPGRPPVREPVSPSTNGTEFTLTLPDIGYRNHDSDGPEWQLWAVASDASRHPVAFPAEEPGQWIGQWIDQWIGERGGSLAWCRSRFGAAAVHEVGARPIITNLSLAGDEIVVSLGWLGAAPQRWGIDLVGDRVSLPGAVRTSGEDGAEVVFSTTCDEWGLGPATAPPGQYRFELNVEDTGVQTQSVVVAEQLTERTPLELQGEQLRVRAQQTPRRRLVVHLQPPLNDDELGPRAQALQQARYAAARHELDPTGVYLQAYTGQTPTDSSLAIHQRLRVTHPELTLYWGVADQSVHLPEGAVPVLMRSRRWYDVLGSAAFLVNNIDFDAWFVKQPGQRFLQTFHGYPAKSMGLVQWRAKRFSEAQIAAELDRTARKWDLILTPVPEMDEYYRREYAYEGPIHNQGYPRDDALTSQTAQGVRLATRHRLRIEPGQTAVLYAPTFRDHLATAHRSAALVQHLDLETASEALGPDYVFLMRGHRFHARGAERLARSRRMVDVTDYPEINDLVLAADAAVLDYSSLRFDFALTGKPMVFLVPDLEMYSGDVRGFLYDYASTAPGPLLRDADDVVRALRDLDALAGRYREQIAAFNRSFQYWQDGHAAARVVDAFFGPGGPRA